MQGEDERKVSLHLIFTKIVSFLAALYREKQDFILGRA